MKQLYPYQRLGAQFLASRQRALLGDHMGLGKSVQAICAAKALNASSLVVACPAIARPNWARELQMWNFTGRCLVQSYDRITCNRELREEIKAMKPDVMILDESQYLKSPKAKRTRAIYGPRCLGDGLVKHAKHVWALSGTPMPNNPTEVWPMFAALFPTLIPQRLGGDKPLDWFGFLSKYCLYTKHPQFGIQIQGCRRPEELRDLFQQCWLRRKPEDVEVDLPPISWATTLIDPKLTGELREYMRSPEYEKIQGVVRAAIEKDGNLNIPYLSTIRRLTGLAKARASAGMIESELEGGEYKKIVVFYIHREVGAQLQEKLGGFGLVRIDGTTPANARQQLIDRFQTDPEVRVLLGQLKTCGTAINLQGSSQVVFVESSWTPSDNTQGAKRCHRIGSKNPVFVRMLTLQGSIDEAVNNVLRRKAAMVSQIEDGAKL